jgi:serine/threonine protein kinase
MRQRTPHMASTEKSPPQEDPNQGKVLADTYQVIRLLGQGGMGRVYEVGHTRLTKKRYAVKILRADAAADPEAYARFRREAEITSGLGHPHIVEVHDFNVTGDGQPFIVMEFLEGEDLYDHLQRRGEPLHRSEVLRILTQVTSGLKAAHDAGVIHRDLKPENIYLARQPEGDPQVKLLDFGLSKIKHGKSRLTKQNAVFGTPHYMAPEQADGKSDDVDVRSDIYALGVIVYQCLCGDVPFDAPTPLGVLYKVINEAPKPLTERAPQLPPELDAVVGKAMAKAREERHESVDDFMLELSPILERPGRMSGPMDLVTADQLDETEQRKDTDRDNEPPVEASARATAAETSEPRVYDKGMLPLGAPPLPRDALKTPAGVPIPSVVVADPSLALSRVASGEISLPVDKRAQENGARAARTRPITPAGEAPPAPAQADESDTDKVRKASIPPGSDDVAGPPSGPTELPLDPALHNADTGEVELPPDATTPFVKVERRRPTRTGVVVLVILAVLLIAAFVAVMLFTASFGES